MSPANYACGTLGDNFYYPSNPHQLGLSETMDINSHSMPLSLPLLPETKNWSAEIQAAYENIQHTYDHAIRVLRAEGADPTRIAFHVDAISSNALPILEALTPNASNTDSDSESDEMSESLPVKWLADVAMVLGCVVSGLEHLGTTANEE